MDDPNHPLDIERRVREVIEIIWKDRAEAIEHEACEILGVKSLRDYFRKPAGFFADHLKRYSKSRRQAPIYWPLSTASGSLHALDLLPPPDRPDPAHGPGRLRGPKAQVRPRGNRRTSRIPPTNEPRLEELQDLEEELDDFRAEIERIIKLPWKPNLNDGVLITASPLWKLFRLPKWQKDLKACWEELEKGEYDWAHLAYSIWPSAWREACKTDRSIAIAHGLEHLCQVEPPEAKGKRGGRSEWPSDLRTRKL